jgi:hypothetical protein
MSKKPRTGRTPDILRMGGPIKDRSKYDRKDRPDEALDDWPGDSDSVRPDDSSANPEMRR